MIADRDVYNGLVMSAGIEINHVSKMPAVKYHKYM